MKTPILLLLLATTVAVPGATARQADTGYASWYNRGYHGLPTSSGEVYDHEAMTAAHRTIPFGTLVRVTRLDTGRNVIVRVNDRMAPGPGHIIDLSGAAAREMDMLRIGVAQVRVEVVGHSATNPMPGNVMTSRAATPSGAGESVAVYTGRPIAYRGNGSTVPTHATTAGTTSTPSYPGVAPAGRFTLQLGAYARRDTAEKMAGSYPDTYIVTSAGSTGVVYRVFYNSFTDEATARAEQARLWDSGQDSFLRRL